MHKQEQHVLVYKVIVARPDAFIPNTLQYLTSQIVVAANIKYRRTGASEKTFGPGLDNETVLETSYKFQLSQNFSLTPDVQVVFNPANDPSESSVWVVGLRAIFSL